MIDEPSTPRLFLDANVIFTAAISPDGVSASLFALQSSGSCVLLASHFVVDEAMRNVRLKYPEHAGAFSDVVNHLLINPEPSKASVKRASSLLPAKDAPVLAAAVASRAHVLVTGDRRNFGALCRTSIEQVLILSPRDALEWLLS